jgi:hypothetical protein
MKMVLLREAHKRLSSFCHALQLVRELKQPYRKIHMGGTKTPAESQHQLPQREPSWNQIL